jgi:hypothetical protein
MSNYTMRFEKEDRAAQGTFLLLGTFLAGPFWLLGQRLWMPGLLYFIGLLATFGMGWLFMPFLSGWIVRAWYESQGYRRVPVVEAARGREPISTEGIILATLGVMVVGAFVIIGATMLAIRML